MESGLWEYDFLTNHIFPESNVFVGFDNLSTSIDVLVFQSRKNSYLKILNLVEKTKPKIIVCMSDECPWENLGHFNQLGNYCDLFLRQYHHPNYVYTPNTLHIPLGYTNGCKVFSGDKKLKWSFFGQIKTDRLEMINQFKQLSPHFIGNSSSKELMCKIYSQSIFVPCGRGNSSLNCFRLYEASMNGSIPVVVGKKEEIELTFKYEENPPWIFAETWEQAFDSCINLLRSGLEFEPVVEWWNRRIFNLNKKISQIL